MVGGLPRVTGPAGESREGFSQFRLWGAGLGCQGEGRRRRGSCFIPAQ